MISLLCYIVLYYNIDVFLKNIRSVTTYNIKNNIEFNDYQI